MNLYQLILFFEILQLFFDISFLAFLAIVGLLYKKNNNKHGIVKAFFSFIFLIFRYFVISFFSLVSFITKIIFFFLFYFFTIFFLIFLIFSFVDIYFFVLFL